MTIKDDLRAELGLTETRVADALSALAADFSGSFAALRALVDQLVDAPPAPVRRLRKGHYAKISGNPGRAYAERRAEVMASLPRVGDSEHVHGAWLDVSWAEAERSVDLVQEVADWLGSRGKALCVCLSYKDFMRARGLIPQDVPAVDYSDGRWIATVWRPEVGERFLRLVSRFAERFDNHEALETFECNESALNTVPSLVAAGYTPDAMEKFYRSLYDVCGESFRRANPLANLNFWVTPDRTAALLAHAVEVGCGLSATDINERSYAIQAFRGQVGGVDYRGRGITFLAEVSIATLDRYLATATPTLIM